MSDKEAYIVVGETTKSSLEKRVNLMIKEGYIPQGGPLVYRNKFDSLVYAQAMVLKGRISIFEYGKETFDNPHTRGP